VDFHCSRCVRSFESQDDDPRCPKCLRKSSVIDPRAPRIGANQPPSKPFWPRFAVAFPACSLLFFCLSMSGNLMGVPRSWAMHLFASLLGGLFLALPSTLFQLPGTFGAFGPHPPAKPPSS